jgi:DNA-directed RNA polymerase subunit RPC12/RpoP
LYEFDANYTDIVKMIFENRVEENMSSTCPDCNSRAYKRNGYTRHGKQNHRCLDCGRQFSLEPYIVEQPPISFESVETFLSDSLVILKEMVKQ